ncbi:hypothetical protein Vadar_017967 [Vaccinium darrowii]|uniref:Uncharacterized protein n=1 Tax=Vaccinium darrowii TaxID=229202 RepID=A0ACB7Y0H4_9ERIC|nr:hypothetical protein Vadar_017967 [Vaccinium darrowii]
MLCTIESVELHCDCLTELKLGVGWVFDRRSVFVVLGLELGGFCCHCTAVLLSTWVSFESACLLLGLNGEAMVKRKHAATKKTGFSGQPKDGSGPSKGPTENLGKRPVVEPNEEEERKKRKQEEEERVNKEKWVKKIKKGVFNCERQVDLKKMEEHPAVQSIVRQGLRFFFEKRGMYRKKMVKTFYENMVIHKPELEIVSTVGGQRVVVTPNSIAEYLHYRRPDRDSITYPRRTWEKPLNEQVHILTDDPNSYDIEDGKYVVGRLREKYRALNKIMHCNLTPFSNERIPSTQDGEMLVVFGSETDVVDWARRVWNEIRDFRERGGARGKIPFPLMISALCEKAKCKPASGDELVPGSPGPITAGSWNKSKALSKNPRAETVGSSMPTAKKGVERVNQYCEILRCRQQILMDDNREIKASQRRQKRKMGKMMRMLRWLVQCETARSGKEYVETEEDKVPDTSDSEESFDFEQEDEDEDDVGEYHEEEDDDE